MLAHVDIVVMLQLWSIVVLAFCPLFLLVCAHVCHCSAVSNAQILSPTHIGLFACVLDLFKSTAGIIVYSLSCFLKACGTETFEKTAPANVDL
jgi:hypothetical protein